MDLEKIRKLCENREGGLKKLAADIGMSEVNLHRCLRNNKIQANDLEKIAKLLCVNIGVFFDNKLSTYDKNRSIEVRDTEEVALLRELCETQRQTIRLQGEKIALLEGKEEGETSCQIASSVGR